MNKTALITGASSGIGWETARILAMDYKYKVVAIARNVQKLHLLKKQIADEGGTILTLPFDLMSENLEPVKDFLASNNISMLDILINNAGLLINKPFVEMKHFDLVQSFTVNAFAPYFLIQQLLPLLKKSGHAHVVNISSMGGFQGSAKFPGLSAYSSSKAALTCITECLAEELKPSKININCLCLGSVDTEMLTQAFPGIKAPLSAAIMAQFIANFADESHKVMNGKVLPVALSIP